MAPRIRHAQGRSGAALVLGGGAAQEQTAGIEQINEAISQMDQVTQQNAALVEEAAAASQSMQEQSAKLAGVVSVFQLDGQHARQGVGAARPVTRAQAAADRKTPAAIAHAAPAVGSGKKASRRQPVAAADGWEAF